MFNFLLITAKSHNYYKFIVITSQYSIVNRTYDMLQNQRIEISRVYASLLGSFAVSIRSLSKSAIISAAQSILQIAKQATIEKSIFFS